MIKHCKNCKQEFEITSDDEVFYRKIDVPPPTFCPECRLQRRLSFRNERTLYKRKCDATGKGIISVYSEGASFPVYDREYWWGDGWDAMKYGADYDFSVNFFHQYTALRNKVPRINLNANFVYNSDYCNYVGDVKNSYLCFGSIAIEDCFYGSPYESKNCVDVHLARESEFCYECIDCEKMSHSLYSQDCSNSIDLFACFDCKNCQDCIGCVGLRNKKYHIFNEGYAKDDYEKKKNEIFERGREGFSEVLKRFAEFKNGFPHRFATVIQCSNATGDHVIQSKDIHRCFDVKQCEKSRYCMRMIDNRDCADTNFCEFMELAYEYIGFWKNADIKFSNTCGESTHVTYCDFCYGCSYLFGCVGLTNKSYCILNRQYTKEEYESLVPKIIEHMNKMPYISAEGKIYKYGEFFPPELSPFAYNETLAQEYFPLTKEDALNKGYKWRDIDEKNYKISIPNEQLPDRIENVENSITEEVIQCGSVFDPKISGCATAFRIIPAELQFYRKMNLPLPHLCPNCRHYERLLQRNPLKLWHRKCMNKGCENEFETSYSPERPEIIYCEQCYQAEVI